jgi:hypothetical protein
MMRGSPTAGAAPREGIRPRGSHRSKPSARIRQISLCWPIRALRKVKGRLAGRTPGSGHRASSGAATRRATCWPPRPTSTRRSGAATRSLAACSTPPRERGRRARRRLGRRLRQLGCDGDLRATPLTTDPHIHDIGRLAAQHLLSLIDDGAPPSARRPTARLVVRGSPWARPGRHRVIDVESDDCHQPLGVAPEAG